jgi:hypothetical protein
VVRTIAFVAGLLAIATVITVLVWPALRGSSTASASATIDEFHSVERQCLQTFNSALAQQRANQIDELGLADVIDHDVLPPWRAFRSRADRATDVPERIRPVLAKYLAARQISWEAFVTALRSPSDPAARPHYDTYHQKNAEATDAARELGPLLR